MTTAGSPDIFQHAWQTQEVSPTPQLAEIRLRASTSTRRLRWRNAREQMAGAVVTAAIVMNIVRGGFNGVTDAGNVLAVLGVGYVMYQIQTRGRVRALPSALGLTAAVAFYRAELERQRDLLMSVWRWYLLPLLPGLVVVTFGRWLEEPAYWTRLVWTMAGTVVMFPTIAWMNRRAAARVQGAIDALAGDAAEHAVPSDARGGRPRLTDVLPSWVSLAVFVAVLPLLLASTVGLIPPRAAASPIPALQQWWLILSFAGVLVTRALLWLRQSRS